MPDPIDAATLAECLRRLNACGVEVRSGNHAIAKVVDRFEYRCKTAVHHCTVFEAHDAMLRTCVEELIRLANEEGATVTQRDTAYQAWCDLARNVRTPLLAAVDAVCRLREEARR